MRPKLYNAKQRRIAARVAWRRYSKTPKGRLACKRKLKRWKINHPDRWRACRNRVTRRWQKRNMPTVRKWRRKAVVKWKRKNPGKYRAHCLVAKALRMGTLRRKRCRKCGRKKVEAHHKDYRKPLEVVWLCKRHHRMEHGKAK